LHQNSRLRALPVGSGDAFEPVAEYLADALFSALGWKPADKPPRRAGIAHPADRPGLARRGHSRGGVGVESVDRTLGGSMHKRAAACTALALVTWGSASIAADSRTADLQRVDALFERWDRSDSPGCSLGIVRDGRLIYERGYGMANLEHHIPITPDTVFRIASVSKQFTAMSLLLLAQDGALSLDDDIRDYLPEMPDYGRRISLRHLMQHASGIRDYEGMTTLLGIADEDRYVEQEILELLARQKALNFAPGARYLYSNSGYVLLGEIVERVSGKALRQFVDERIFQPLGMHASRIRDDHTEIVEHRASGYAAREGGGFRIAESYYDLVGDDSVFTTVRDLYRWDQNFYHQKVGGAQVAKAQHETLVLNDGRNMLYAAGLEIGAYGGLRFVSHSGSWVGFNAQLLRFPGQQFSVICLCNAGSANPTGLALRTADIFLADQFETPPRRPVVVQRDGSPVVTSAELAAREGLYREPVTHAVARVSVGGPGLLVDQGWGPSAYAAIDRDTFRSADPDAGFAADLVFAKGQSAGSQRFQLLELGEMPLEFEKVAPVSPTPEELQAYTGTYYSEEIETTNRVYLEDGRLYLEYRRSPKTPLQPTQKDQFTVDALRVEFERNAEGRISGYAIWYDWAWNLRFVRRDPRGGSQGP
jgi:CubicO group peptidase (beta-lactamase class C family)